MIYLWGSFHSSETSKTSVKRLLAGDLTTRFYVGVVVIGIVIPLIITVSLWGGDLSNSGTGLFYMRLVCVAVGDLMIRFLIMKSPLYSPLI